MTPSPIALTLAGALLPAVCTADIFAQLSPFLRWFHALISLAVYLALVILVIVVAAANARNR